MLPEERLLSFSFGHNLVISTIEGKKKSKDSLPSFPTVNKVNSHIYKDSSFSPSISASSSHNFFSPPFPPSLPPPSFHSSPSTHLYHWLILYFSTLCTLIDWKALNGSLFLTCDKNSMSFLISWCSRRLHFFLSAVRLLQLYYSVVCIYITAFLHAEESYKMLHRSI